MTTGRTDQTPPADPERTDEPPHDPHTLEMAKEAWKATLGALGSAEEDTHALLARMVHVGRITREEGVRLFTEVRGLVETRRNELEAHIQNAIDTTLKRLTIPTHQELSEVAQKLAELERRVEALDDAIPPPERPARPAKRRKVPAPG